ncbi:MAG: presenilin family intramembrane aspartyl protease [Candidatus Micrarchaeia archaeon]
MRQVAVILAFFLAVQFLGLYIGAVLELNRSEFAAFNVAVAPEGGIAPPLLFLVAVVAGAAFLVILFHFYKGLLLFKLMEAFIILVASNIVFYVILLSLGIPFYYALAFLLSLGVALAKFFSPRFKNLAAILASAGVGAVFGFSLDLLPAVIFVVGLSLYDVLAVFFTRHMVVMAQELGRRNLAFSVSAEQKVKVKLPRRKAPVEQRSVLELGTGDLSIPCMLAVSAFKYGNALSLWHGAAYALASIGGSSLALVLVLYAVLRGRLFLPALPPLAFGGLAGIALARLLYA